MGREGYIRQARNVINGAKNYYETISEFDEDLQVLNDEDQVLNTVVFKGKNIDSWLLCDTMEDKGWKLDRLWLGNSVKAIGFIITVNNRDNQD